MKLFNEFFIAFNDFLFASMLMIIFLISTSIATYVGMIIYKKIEKRRNKKNTIYIRRSDGKTKVVKDKNGNIIEVTNIKEL